MLLCPANPCRLSAHNTHATGSRNWHTSNRSSLYALVSSRTQVPLRVCNNLLWNRHLRIKCKFGTLIWSKSSHGFTGPSLLCHRNRYFAYIMSFLNTFAATFFMCKGVALCYFQLQPKWMELLCGEDWRTLGPWRWLSYIFCVFQQKERKKRMREPVCYF